MSWGQGSRFAGRLAGEENVKGFEDGVKTGGRGTGGRVEVRR
jgi:hypothetical protein